jgi:hypothetical protein
MKKLILLLSLVVAGLLVGCNPDHSGDTRIVTPASAPKKIAGVNTLPPQAQKGLHGAAPGL